MDDRDFSVQTGGAAMEGISTIIFDVDDTLYDVNNGFSEHRNSVGAQSFMVRRLGFASLEEAEAVRSVYFARYHSTAKGLTVAEQEGKLPEGAPKFDTQDLAEWWATQLDFTLLHHDTDGNGRRRGQLLKDMLSSCPLQIAAFSNGPRKYVKRVLIELDVWECFGEDRLFAVDDVLPFCKPEAGAFQVVFDKLNVKASECIMVEDSMKNIRASKSLGLRTVLVTGRQQRLADSPAHNNDDKETAGAKAGDLPNASNPAVDVAIESCEELRDVFPGLWKSPLKR